MDSGTEICAATTLGCGLAPDHNEVFFTCEGEVLPLALKCDAARKFMPYLTVGAGVSVNFGQQM